MSEPLALAGATPGDNVYAIARRQSDGAAWNATADQWEQTTNENWPVYSVALDELPGLFWHAAEYPAAWDAESIEVLYYRRAGENPANTDAVLGGESRFAAVPTGAFAVTVDTSDADSDHTLAGVRVRFSRNGQATLVTTSEQGVVTLGLDAGTYQVTATLPGYQHAPQTVGVEADATVHVALTAIALQAPDDPSLSRGALTTLDAQGQPVAACPIKFRMTSGPGTAGHSFPRSTFELTSDTHGHLQADMVRGAQYEAHRGSGDWVAFTVPDASTFTLPEILSQPA